MKEEKQELIIVKQLPIIEERLKGLSIEIDEKVKYAKSLVVSDETVKDVKKVRAELSKEFKELEHGFGAALGYSMINDGLKTVDDAINEATLDMRANKEEANS